MLTVEKLASIDKDQLPEISGTLGRDDLEQLVQWLSSKDDDIRYPSFLLLQNRSRLCGDVYPYWDEFRARLESGNSFQRNIGLVLLAENARWDAEGRTESVIDQYLELLYDEKPITVRQCVQSLEKIVPHKPELNAKIAGKLMSLDLASVRETMRKLVLFDILNVLLAIRKETKSDEIEGFILRALSGELLDKKLKKQIEARL